MIILPVLVEAGCKIFSQTNREEVLPVCHKEAFRPKAGMDINARSLLTGISSDDSALNLAALTLHTTCVIWPAIRLTQMALRFIQKEIIIRRYTAILWSFTRLTCPMV